MGSQGLIGQARSGDRAALQQLLVMYSTDLRDHIARRLPTSLQNVISVDDVLQETLCDAYLNLDRLRGSSSRTFVTWMKTIGEVTLLEFMRAESAQKRGGQWQRRRHVQQLDTDSLADLLENLPGDATTGSRAVARDEALTALQVAIAGLPAEQRQAIQLHLLRGYTVEATAAEMGRTPGAIRGLVHRGKQNLAESMGHASAWLSSK